MRKARQIQARRVCIYCAAATCPKLAVICFVAAHERCRSGNLPHEEDSSAAGKTLVHSPCVPETGASISSPGREGE